MGVVYELRCLVHARQQHGQVEGALVNRWMVCGDGGIGEDRRDLTGV